MQGTVLTTQDFSSSFRTAHLCQELIFITLHMQRERDKVIRVGVHIYVYVFVVQKKFESYFRD